MLVGQKGWNVRHELCFFQCISRLQYAQYKKKKKIQKLCVSYWSRLGTGNRGRTEDGWIRSRTFDIHLSACFKVSPSTKAFLRPKITQTPENFNNGEKYPTRICKVCSSHKIKGYAGYMHGYCNVALHKGDFFERFHSFVKYWLLTNCIYYIFFCHYQSKTI